MSQFSLSIRLKPEKKRSQPTLPSKLQLFWSSHKLIKLNRSRLISDDEAPTFRSQRWLQKGAAVR
jgi:hypothetical protein